MVWQARIDALTASTDINGSEIRVGDRVRSFDFPMHDDEGDRLLGMELTGERASYVEGIVEAIGSDVIEGCPRYRIRVTRTVPSGRPHRPVLPPVNGTPRMLGGKCFGVVRIP